MHDGNEWKIVKFQYSLLNLGVSNGPMSTSLRPSPNVSVFSIESWSEQLAFLHHAANHWPVSVFSIESWSEQLLAFSLRRQIIKCFSILYWILEWATKKIKPTAADIKCFSILYWILEWATRQWLAQSTRTARFSILYWILEWATSSS